MTESHRNILDSKSYELLKAISVEMYNLLPLPNASEALEDALDEMKQINQYYLSKSSNAARVTESQEPEWTWRAVRLWRELTDSGNATDRNNIKEKLQSNALLSSVAADIRGVELETRLNGHEYLDGSEALAKAAIGRIIKELEL